MCVCIYVCMYTYVYMYVYIYMCMHLLCMHVYMCIYACIYIHMILRTDTHNFFFRVPRCRAPGVGCYFGLGLTSRLCTLHVVLFYWLWLKHGLYGLHLHAGLFFSFFFFFLCTLHVVLFYWLWLKYGVYGLRLHAGVSFSRDLFFFSFSPLFFTSISQQRVP